MLTHVAILHSLYSIRHLIAHKELGIIEPGVQLIEDTRNHFPPMLRVFAWLHPRMLQPEYSSQRDAMIVFLATLGVTLASVKACVAALQVYRCRLLTAGTGCFLRSLRTRFIREFSPRTLCTSCVRFTPV